MVAVSKFAKNIAYWTIPPGLQILLFNLRERIYQILKGDAQERVLLRKNFALRDIHKGERCFILATGPSIKHQDLKLLQDEICIAVSNFFVHPDYAVVDPKYHCIAPYHPPITEVAWQNWMDEIEKSTRDTKMFFGLTDKNRNESRGYFKGRDLYYLRFGGLWGKILPHDVDISRTLPGPQSVTIMALYIALYMGFKEIYLLGCDHDWLLHMNKSRHFYPEKNHAIVRSGYNEWFQEDLEEQFQDYIILWQQYKVIREIANQKGVRIFNATEGGLLDVFPRAIYEALFTSDPVVAQIITEYGMLKTPSRSRRDP